MPKSAAKAFVSAVSDAMAFLVVDPSSGAVKKLKATAALATALAPGLMSASQFEQLTKLTSGTYTPSVTKGSGVTSVGTVVPHLYWRVGDGVLVIGQTNVTFVGGSNGVIHVPLPIASGLSAATDVIGVPMSGPEFVSGFVDGDVSNNGAKVGVFMSAAATRDVRYVFGYRVQ